MKVELSIKDDKELRNLIKDEIKNAVRGLTRQEIMWKVQDEVMASVEKVGGPQKYVDLVMRDIIKQWVYNALKPMIGRDVVERTISEEVRKALKEIEF